MRDQMDMDQALQLDGEKLRQLTGVDHGPWDVSDYHLADYQPPCAGYDESLVAAAMTGAQLVVIDPISLPWPPSTASHALAVAGSITLGEQDAAAERVARYVSIRQAAGEAGPAFVRRITLAMLVEVAA